MKPPRVAECSPPDTFPAEIVNRPALDRIAYRIGVYADARRWLLRRLDEDPVLASWTYRGADDPGIALYEGAALLIDLLTLYQDAYANEAYLRTAKWRESVADLVRLLGYRLKPGIGGAGTFAFEVKGNAPVALPAELPLKADLADISDSANFQTRGAATALPWLSRFSLVRPQEAGTLASGTTKLVVAGGQTFAKNDRLLIGTEIVLVESATSWHGRTVITLQSGLRRPLGATTVAYKLGRTFRHFGHNAPAQRIEVTAEGKAIGHWVSYTRDLVLSGLIDAEAAPFPLLASDEFALEPQVTDLRLGTRLFMPMTIRTESGEQRRLYIGRVIEQRNVTASYGALSGPATIVKLELEDHTPRLRRPPNVAVDVVNEAVLAGKGPGDFGGITFVNEFFDIRELQLDTLGEPFVVGAEWHDTPAQRGAKLAYWGDATQARDLASRAIAIVPAAAPAYAAVVVDVQQTVEPDLSIVTLDREVDYAQFSDAAGTLVFGNLVDATEGKAEPLQVLGSGDERTIFQSFEVPKAPLTYLNRPALTPPAQPEIEIVVGNRIWSYVDSLYGHGPDEEIYVVRQDDEGRSWVQFGDGKMGARLPSGIDNVQIRWRTGSGAFGPIKRGAQVTTGKRIDEITAVSLPGVIAGGSAPETADAARVAAPLRVQSLDRLVSLTDIEAETLAIGGVERASAAWAIKEGLPSIEVVVLMQEKRSAELADVQQILATANRARGPDRYVMHVVAGAAEYVYLDLTVAIDPAFEPDAVRGAVRAAIAALFAKRSFGEPEYAARIEGSAQNVAGVRWATVNAFGSLGVADDPVTLTYPATPTRAETVACPPTHVLRLSDGVFMLRGAIP